MMPFETLKGSAIPLGLKNIDTDVIIGAERLKVTTREGLGRFAFETLRSPNPGNVIDSARAAGACILIAGDNFGCGSSREHAVWAIADLGIRAVIAPSFGDIFSGNAFKNGILLVELPQEQVDRLLARAKDTQIVIDLNHQTVTCAENEFPFVYDPFRKTCLLQGLDEIGLTEGQKADIERYVSKRAQAQPWSLQASRRGEHRDPENIQT